MKNKFLIIIISLTVFFSGSSNCVQAQYSTQGQDFWFSFMPNIGAATAMVSITCDVNTSGVISMPGQGWTQNFTVTQNTTTQITIPNMYNPIVTVNQTIQPQAIHIVANDPVSVYAFNDQAYTTDATIILPTPVLGNEYYITTYEPLASVRSGLLIVGAENNSIISITPSQTTQGGNPPGVPFN
ncbi:MAG: IgGFc-binding protein, partial [Flavobacteriales bacterium]|nr:IgGFc-binding protein [Flavobacteriales bacterium]